MKSNTKNVSILAVTALLATFAITGCTSKPVAKNGNATALAGANGVNGVDGANSTGLGANGDLNSTGLNGSGYGNGANGGVQDAVRRALLARVVHFDLDSSDIAQSDFAVLNAHASYLASNGAAHAVLTGHTDERGTREYNMALGERRAKSVQTYLVTNGARADQIDVVSYGKEKPVNEAHDESAWAENRRVEIGYDKLDPNK
ncbi:MAG: peptidoglycan-associated lipoprotein Pal [Candidatus Saccharibacteria bacterium]|nr:peptidoglycan-associated lipoprotein Pal [Moraxellaceae bacterium]